MRLFIEGMTFIFSSSLTFIVNAILESRWSCAGGQTGSPIVRYYQHANTATHAQPYEYSFVATDKKKPLLPESGRTNIF